MIKYLCLSEPQSKTHCTGAPRSLVAGGRVIQCYDLRNSRQSTRIQSQEKARRDAVNQTSPPNQRGADLVGFRKRNTQNDNCETFKPTEFRVTLSLFNTVLCLVAPRIPRKFPNNSTPIIQFILKNSRERKKLEKYQQASSNSRF